MTFASFNMTILTLIFHFTLRLNIMIVQFTSVTQSCPTLCDAMDYTQVHWVEDAIQPSHPLSSSYPPAPNPSQHQGLFKRVSSSHQGAKVLEFQLQYQPLQWTPRTISFRMDWLDLLPGQGTLKSLPQHKSSKSSILPCSAFIIVQLSHSYLTTGETIALTRQNFVGKVMSLLYNMQSRFVKTYLPNSKHLLISWQQSPSAVILETRKINSVTFYPIFAMKWWGQTPWS